MGNGAEPGVEQMAGPIDELFEVTGGCGGRRLPNPPRRLQPIQPVFGEGEILHGHVLSVSDKEVIVDIGRKIEGLVPASQFPLWTANLTCTQAM